MNALVLIVAVIVGVATLCALYLSARGLRPMLRALMALGHDSDSLQARVFPMLGFLGLLAILLKLTIF